MFFVMSLRLSDHNFFSLSNFWSLRSLRKQFFHSRLLDMRLVIATSYPTRAHGIIVKYSPALKTTNFQTITLLVVHLCLCNQLI